MNQDIEEQFLKAHDAYADALFRHCYFRVYDRELAKDLTQETFCRTWTYLAEGKEIGNIRAFLYRVLHHVIVDEIRRKKSISLDRLIEKGFSPQDESFLEGEDQRRVVTELLQKLSRLDEPYRDAVRMRFVDELSPKEIASILGVSENVVSVRIHRGTKKLRHLLHAEQA
ncbi:MAG: sigma-70 family RNA polymerase sigma factor [bacterium]|nr:sigma-70 family RNA polymerase sigma factor [bacterium]